MPRAKADPVPEPRKSHATRRQAGPEAVVENYNRYVEVVRDAYLQAQRRFEAAYRRHVESVSANLREASQSNALRTYIEHVQDALSRRDVQRLNDAGRQYARLIEEANSRFQRTSDESYAKLVADLQNDWTELQQGLEAAFENFLTSTVATIDKLDAGPTAVQTIDATGRTLSSAAYLRAYQRPR
jgi:hypothetical protein